MAPGEADNREQLDLFASRQAHDEPARALSRADARAAVSPGWWAHTDLLFRPGAAWAVDDCREADGKLVVRAHPLDIAADACELEELLEAVRESCARTCGSCGSRGADVSIFRVAEQVHTVCAACRQHLERGETYAVVTHLHWRFDGQRRRIPIIRPVANRSAQRETHGRAPTRLAPEELRRTIIDLDAAMRSKLIGQDAAVSRLALVAGLHVGGELERGARALVVGPTGVGKTSLVIAMRDALHDGGWDLPFVLTDALDLTSPGWSGAPSIGDLLERAIEPSELDGRRARHAIVVIDEIAHALVTPDVEGNMRAKRREVLASLLSLVGHGTVRLGDGGREWSSRQALVIGMGAFTGQLDFRGPVPSAAAFSTAGLPLELTTRFEEAIVLRPLREPDVRSVLERWPALVSLADVSARLGYRVRVHPETYALAARAVVQGIGAATVRSAGGWLVAALREALIAALGAEGQREILISPDSLRIPRAVSVKRGPDEGGRGGESHAGL